MAVTAENSGTQTAVIGTEHFVDDIPTVGVFTFHVDLNAMVDGDVTELRVSQMVLTAGTSRVLFFQAFYGAVPAELPIIAASLPASNELAAATALRVSIKQTFGTGRAYPWKVLRHN